MKDIKYLTVSTHLHLISTTPKSQLSVTQNLSCQAVKKYIHTQAHTHLKLRWVPQVIWSIRKIQANNLLLLCIQLMLIWNFKEQLMNLLRI